MSQFKTIIFTVAILAAAVALMAPHDSTDPPDGRSGMGLHVDHMTGCHYLTSANLFGETSITPRLRADGTQVCTGEETNNN